MLREDSSGGSGGGGGTFGGPSTTTSAPTDDPSGLTGMSSGSLNSGVLLNTPYSGGGDTILPTDIVHVGTRGSGYTKGRGLGVALDQGMTYSQAQGLPGTWYANDQSFYKQFVNKLTMYKYPNAGADMGIQQAMSAWDDLLKMSITLNKSSKGKQWTPWDVLETYNHPAGSLGTRRSGNWIIDNATGEKVKYVGPKTKTTKQTAIDLSDPEQVQAIAQETLAQLIGRAPTDKELAQFKATLNGYEKAHPEVTTTTEHIGDMGEVTSTDSVHSGGVSDAARASLLGSGVKKTKEYGKYQSGTTYFNALMQMIGGG